MLYIDVTRLYKSTQVTRHYTGVDRVNLAYIRQFGKQSCAVIRYPKYWLFLPYQLSQVIFDSFFNQNQVTFNQNRWIRRLNKYRYGHPKQGEQNFLLHTYHGGLEKPEFMGFMDKYQLKGIYFLHDLIPIDYPEYCRDGEKQKHQIRLKTMSQGELVICNSQYTLSRWQGYCEKNGLTLPKSIYAHLGLDDTWQKPVVDKTELEEFIVPTNPYFVVLGTIEARKNHLLLLNIWRELYRELGKDCPELLIVGKRGWECEQVLDILDRSDELKQVVTEINHTSDSQVRALLHNCQALLFPSFEEGYGLPLIEGVKSGSRVIASDIPVFKEINIDDIATLLPVIDGKLWKKIIMEYCHFKDEDNWSYQQKLASILPRLPTWQQHFNVITPYLDFL